MDIEIRARNVELSEQLQQYARRRADFAVGRFADQVDRVTIAVADINGPRGGVDKRCRVTVKARGAWTITVRDTDADLHGVIARAMARAGHAVSRRVQRRRLQAHGAWRMRWAMS